MWVYKTTHGFYAQNLHHQILGVRYFLPPNRGRSLISYCSLSRSASKALVIFAVLASLLGGSTTASAALASLCRKELKRINNHIGDLSFSSSFRKQISATLLFTRANLDTDIFFLYHTKMYIRKLVKTHVFTILHNKHNNKKRKIVLHTDIFQFQFLIIRQL